MSGQNAADSVPAEETEMVDKSAQNGTDPAMDAEAPRPDPRRRFSRMHSVSKHPSPTKLSWLQASLAIVILFLVVVVVVLVGVMVSGHADDDALVNGDGGADNDHDGEDEQLDLRLPDDVVPVTYDLKLQTFLDPSQFRFTGTVVIQIVCKASTSVITLHAKDLAIDEAAVSLTNVNSSYPDPRIDGFANDTRKQQFSIRLENGLDEGQEVRLAIPFRGKLRDDLSGFYLSEHVTPEGETKYLASTQFQPTAARKAFPCFDEPLFKARFKLTLIHETGFNSLSNAAKVDRYVRDDGWIVDVYEPTVKMSTYLVAFVVCDFASKEATSESGVVVRVWARKDAIEQANYALQVATKTLTYFEDYFHLQFPLSKLEIVAVPDHAFSAMENWGLILFQESKMLLEDNVSSLANKEYVVLAVSHELAHQWFGNLVTAKWWDDLWLNEGFASFVAQLGIQNIDPSSSMDERLIKREFPRAMVTDSLTTSHPIFATVHNPEQIGEIFDAISYSKGAAIVRMMSYFLGDDVFRDGLKKYLDDNKYGNTVTNDLWDALTDVAQARGIDVDVASIMNVWIHLTGYPVVTISRNSTSGEMMAEQERFLLDRTAREKRDAERDPIWPIPLTITTESEKQWDSPNVYWLKTEKMNLSSDDLPSNSGWFIGNLKREGYYRVNYDSANWERLIKQLNDDLDAIHHINRATLIDDAYWLSRAGYLDQQTALRISEYMHKEKAYLPWELMLNTWKDWGGLLAWSSGYGEFKKYIRNFLEQQYDLLGWDEREGEAAAKTNMRSEVLKMACQFGHGECTYQAQLLYSAWMRTPHSNRVPANYRSFVYCTAIRQLGVVEWEFAWSQLEKTSSASEKTKLIEAMGCSKEPWLLNRYLNLALESPEIRGGNVAKVISAVSQTAEGRFYAWKFVVGNWADIRKKYGENQFIDRRIIKGVTKYFSTAWELKELEAFVKSLGRLGGGDLMWRQAIEKTRANVRWLEENEKIIEDWVTEKNQYRR